jgi:methionyl-tRNA formyltransferase
MTGKEREITVAVFTRQGETLAGLFVKDLSAHGLENIIVIAQKQPKRLIRKGINYIRAYGVQALWRFLKKRSQALESLTETDSLRLYPVDSLNSAETEKILRDNRVDLGVLANTGIIRKNIIELVPMGIIMPHPGILPGYRGINCTGWAILNGDDIGVTAFLIDQGIDTGPILLREKLDKGKITSRENLAESLLRLRIELVTRSVIGLRDGLLKPVLQKPDEGRLYTEKMLTAEVKKKMDQALDRLIELNLSH